MRIGRVVNKKIMPLIAHLKFEYQLEH